MNDPTLLHDINKLAKEEHELFQRESNGSMSEKDQHRLHELQIMLDQCWDLLRQRRAKREFGQNPNDTEMRDPGTVENYIG